MSYASKAGRAKTNPSNPSAFGVCDRCGLWWNLTDLRFQHDWRGTTLQNLWLRVCNDCYDTPQEQLRSIVLPADPVPVWQPRVEPFAQDEESYMGTTGATIDPETGIPILPITAMATTNSNPMGPMPIGVPNGLTQNATSPLQTVNGVPTHFGVKLNLLSVTSNGTDQISVTCSSPHGLNTNDQVSVEGLSNRLACGFYSVTVTGAMGFTYQVYSPSIPAAGLLEPTTIIWTVLVGLPLGWTQVPLTPP